MLNSKNGQGLAERLLACRSVRKLSLREVSLRVDISVTALSNIERGAAVPRRTTMLRLLAFLREEGYELTEVE